MAPLAYPAPLGRHALWMVELSNRFLEHFVQHVTDADQVGYHRADVQVQQVLLQAIRSDAIKYAALLHNLCCRISLFPALAPVFGGVPGTFRICAAIVTLLKPSYEFFQQTGQV